MANLDGMKMKFTVIKNNDIDKYLSGEDAFGILKRRWLDNSLGIINGMRYSEGKKKNTYIVINTDEPYADEVIEIMKRHGHWG